MFAELADPDANDNSEEALNKKVRITPIFFFIFYVFVLMTIYEYFAFCYFLILGNVL